MNSQRSFGEHHGGMDSKKKNWNESTSGLEIPIFGKSSSDDSGTWIHGDSTFEKEMLC